MRVQRCASILCMFFFWLLQLVEWGSGCEFPVTVQTNSSRRDGLPDRDWRGRIRGQFNEFTLKIEVNKKVMKTVSTDSTAKSNTRVCIQVVKENRYLVAHEEPGQQKTRYTCLQFIHRSADVLQLRVANYSDQMDPGLCNDGALRMDRWLIIDKARIGRERIPCPLHGGFSIHIYDKTRQEGKCDTYRGETRMESECVKDDGLTFYFRRQGCVPEDLYMYYTQPTICLATWRDGRHRYTLLRHENLHHSWILRTPTSPGKQFTAYLFKDILADGTDTATETNQYLRLDTIRDDPRRLSSLCADDYDICAEYTGDLCPMHTLTCPKRCGLCNATRPAMCSLPPEWSGRWSDMMTDESRSVHVMNSSVNISYLSGNETVEQNFHCVRWELESSSADAGVMLVTDFSNGCRPRYTCARARKLSPTFFNLQLSEKMLWPLVRSSSDPIDCRAFSFDIGTDNPATARRRNLMLVYAGDDSREPVACNLPGDFSNYSAKIRGVDCTASLAQTQTESSLELSVVGCSTRGQAAPASYTCLESSRPTPTSDLIIVARSEADSNDNELYCWSFPKASPAVFYLLAGVHCQEVIRRGTVRLDQVTPLITFTKFRKTSTTVFQRLTTNGRWTPTIPTTRRTVSVRQEFTTAMVQHSTSQSRDSDNGEVVVGNSTTSTEQSTISPSPLIVVIVVVILAIVQLVFFCRPSSS